MNIITFTQSLKEIMINFVRQICTHYILVGVFFFQAIFSKLCVFYAEPNNFWMWKTYINTTQNEILVARKGKLVDSYFGKQNPGLVEMCSVVFVWCCWKKQPTNKPTDTAEYLKKWNNLCTKIHEFWD